MALYRNSTAIEPFKFADKKIAVLKKNIEAVFHNLTLTPFDELNVVSTRSLNDKAFTTLRELNAPAFESVAVDAYDSAVGEITSLMLLAGRRFPSFLDGKSAALSIVTALLSNVNSVTGYIYNNEVDRKQSRNYEGMISANSRRKLRENVSKSGRLWFDMSRQYVDLTVDESRIQAFKDAGIEWVMWVTEKDEKVCSECAPMDGEIFRIEDAPGAQHYHCRCHIVPVIRD